MIMNYEEFEKEIGAAGLAPKRCSSVHWQVNGGVCRVNYYPTTRTMFVNGTTKGIFAESVGEIVRTALELPKRVKTEEGSAGRKGCTWTKNQRKKLFVKKPVCHWCGKRFEDPGQATLEHIIPLVRGGSNELQNLALACGPCNHGRGDGATPKK